MPVLRDRDQQPVAWEGTVAFLADGRPCMRCWDSRCWVGLPPQPHEIYIGDIAHALSRICRYGGHVLDFLSVAEHSILVSELVPERFALEGLLHDATEAYVGDMIAPLKRIIPSFRDVEDKVWHSVAVHFKLPIVLPPEVKEADVEAYKIERRGNVAYLTPAEAKRAFLTRYLKLTGPEAGELPGG